MASEEAEEGKLGKEGAAEEAKAESEGPRAEVDRLAEWVDFQAAEEEGKAPCRVEGRVAPVGDLGTEEEAGECGAGFLVDHSARAAFACTRSDWSSRDWCLPIR